ncbi:MAG TPA: hypothetical protein VH062_10675 [Polyangiaceae bacterium]|nr:hypothetical protein [Polyangiaceae bacterium]
MSAVAAPVPVPPDGAPLVMTPAPEIPPMPPMPALPPLPPAPPPPRPAPPAPPVPSMQAPVWRKSVT